MPYLPLKTDLFDFRAGVPGDARLHPVSARVFVWVGTSDAPGHGLDLRCLPAAYNGPLRTVPVVHLYLTPGWG